MTTYEITCRLSIGGDVTYTFRAESLTAARLAAIMVCEAEMKCRARVVRTVSK